MARLKPPKGTVKVRCLGPGPEHTFFSRDKTTHRVCEPCREKMKAMSRIANEPIFPSKD